MTLEEAIKVGRELEKLNYYWYEHPMPEYRVESYVRLCRELTIPILSPEIVAGGVFTRAEWILRGAGGHEPHRRRARRHHRRAQDRDRLPRPTACAARSTWRAGATCRSAARRRRTPANTTRRGCWRPASTTTRRIRICTNTCDRIDAGRLRPPAAGPGHGLRDRVGLHQRQPHRSRRRPQEALVSAGDVEHQPGHSRFSTCWRARAARRPCRRPAARAAARLGPPHAPRPGSGERRRARPRMATGNCRTGFSRSPACSSTGCSCRAWRAPSARRIAEATPARPSTSMPSAACRRSASTRCAATRACSSTCADRLARAALLRRRRPRRCSPT